MKSKYGALATKEWGVVSFLPKKLLTSFENHKKEVLFDNNQFRFYKLFKVFKQISFEELQGKVIMIRFNAKVLVICFLISLRSQNKIFKNIKHVY